MQLAQKIQRIRKENNLTQEQFAEMIYVSRTAVSKWETGRGEPSIDSLQMIARAFNISLDDLLSSEELVVIAKKENNENISRLTGYVDACISISALLAIVLPLYKTYLDGIYCSSYIGNIGGWQGILFCILPIIISVSGLLQFVFISINCKGFMMSIKVVSFVTIIISVLVHILSLQPYPAIFFLLILAAKSALRIKRH